MTDPSAYSPPRTMRTPIAKLTRRLFIAPSQSLFFHSEYSHAQLSPSPIVVLDILPLRLVSVCADLAFRGKVRTRCLKNPFRKSEHRSCAAFDHDWTRVLVRDLRTCIARQKFITAFADVSPRRVVVCSGRQSYTYSSRGVLRNSGEMIL